MEPAACCVDGCGNGLVDLSRGCLMLRHGHSESEVETQ